MIEAHSLLSRTFEGGGFGGFGTREQAFVLSSSPKNALIYSADSLLGLCPFILSGLAVYPLSMHSEAVRSSADKQT